MFVKMISSLIFGLLMILPLDFLFFIALKINYFDAYQIKEYYNVYFFDNQPFLWLLLAGFVVGFLWLYSPLKRAIISLYLIAIILLFVNLHGSIFQDIAKDIFMQKDLTCKVANQTFQADILYNGRHFYHIRRSGIDKTIQIPKEDMSIED